MTRLKKNKRKGHSIPIDQVILKQTEHYYTEFEERIKLVHQHIKQLNPLEKGLILLLLERKKHEEIEEIPGLSPSNVRTRISRIKQKLKTQIIKK